MVWEDWWLLGLVVLIADVKCMARRVLVRAGSWCGGVGCWSCWEGGLCVFLGGWVLDGGRGVGGSYEVM